MSRTSDVRKIVYELRYEEEMEWAEIYDAFPDIPEASLRRLAYQERDSVRPNSDHAAAPHPRVEGSNLLGAEYDDADVWSRAVEESGKRRKKEQRKKNSAIEFSHGPIALVYLADVHAGSTGVDYRRLDRDLSIIESTPGMYAVTVGDLVDNFIVGRLQAVRFGAKFTVREEWVLAKMVLARIGPKLVSSVAGNHDLWTFKTSGIDFLEELLANINPGALYQRFDQPFILSVDSAEYAIRVRHNWRGSSIYNPTHGIERAAKFDKGRHFDVGIGAHTHASGLYRQFNNGGKTGHAILCGSYKVYDTFADETGYPLANESSAVAMVFSKDGAWGTNNLTLVSDYLYQLYEGGE